MEKSEEILAFWFGEDPEHPMKDSSKWWKKDPAFDREIQQKFEADLKRATRGEYDHWKETPRPCMAFIILLDQFSRNIYRDTPNAFAQDPLSLEACLKGMEKGLDRELTPIQRPFFYMPMMHSEDMEVHRRSLQTYQQLAEEGPDDLKKTLEANYDYAGRHAKIIERFGRYPHRNAILGRESTAEEIEFLKEPGSSF